MVEKYQGHLTPDSQWQTYETSVQSYRGLSMSAQSLYLAVGAILLGTGFRIPFYAVFLMAMVTAWYVFFPVIRARTAIVDYHKYHFRQRFDEYGNMTETPPEQPLSERAYANVWRGRALRRRVASQISMPGGERFTTIGRRVESSTSSCLCWSRPSGWSSPCTSSRRSRWRSTAAVRRDKPSGPGEGFPEFGHRGHCPRSA